MDNEETAPENIDAAQEIEQPENHALKPGDRFGNYRVVKCLCAGLIVHYYHMQHIRDLHDVTIGIFHHRVEEDRGFLKRLEGLRKTMQVLDHEAIPKIHDCTSIDERICIFLDPVKGQSLKQYFLAHQESGRSGMSPQATARILAHLLDVLGYTHSHGVDHRDLESDLIYLQEGGSLQVLGLGIKATLGEDLFEAIVSSSVAPLVVNRREEGVNSFDVMSPEYKSGVAEDARADVYGAGFIGYYLLTGGKPDFGEYEPPTKLIGDISPNWDVFFDMSLEHSLDKRYQSCKIALLGLKATNNEPEQEDAGFIQRQINRIPVFKKIVERGELAARIYRLCIVGLIALTLTAICLSFLLPNDTSKVDTSSKVAQLASPGQSTALELKVKPSGAKVEFIGSEESFIVNQGALSLAVQAGNFKLRVSAADYVEQIVEVTIPTEASEPETVEVELEPALTDIAIRTEPGATVSMADEGGLETQLGVADQAGVFVLEKEVFTGMDRVLVKKPGYQPNTLGNQVIDFGNVAEVDAPLLALPASVSVRTQPEGASILFNDTELGATPFSVNDIAAGDEYLVVAQLEGYRPVSRRIKPGPGADVRIDFGELVPLSGALHIEIRVAGENAPAATALHDDLQVIIDGESIPYGDKALGSVPEGEHRIRLEHPLYVSKEITQLVEDQWEYPLNFAMNPRPGVVQIKIPDKKKVDLRIDGKPFSFEGEPIEIPAYENVEFELQIRNYFTMTRNFKLSPTEIFEWEVEPVPIPGPSKGQDWTQPYLGIPIAWVPPGQFEMGSPLEEHARLPSEGPPTSVRFTYGFWMGIYEVSQAQYSEITGQNPSSFKDPARPVESVSWEEAKTFCSLLTNIERDAGRLPEGYVYRLPSEAEWEYAARAGTATPFFFGAEADASVGHFRGVYPRDRKDGLRAPPDYGTSVVGRYEANAFGLFDVHGNVREWTLDRYNGRLEGDSLVDPQPRQQGDRIAVRGGGWEDTAVRVRSAVREEISPEVSSNALGFRVALAPAR